MRIEMLDLEKYHASIVWIISMLLILPLRERSYKKTKKKIRETLKTM